MHRISHLCLIACFVTLQLSAMQQEHQKTTLIDLDENCLRTIAHFVDHRSCVHSRQTCRKLSATFWNDSQPIEICRDSIPRDMPEESFWQALIVKIIAAEAMIKRFNFQDTKKVDIQNAIILKLFWRRLLTKVPEAFAQTTCVRSLDLSGTDVTEKQLSRLHLLLPLLYELKLSFCKKLTNLPQDFIDWTSLRNLSLGSSQIQTTLAERIPRQLESLDVGSLGYQHVPEYLKNMKQLKDLDLSTNSLTPEELSALPPMASQLEELNLSANNLSYLLDTFDLKGLLVLHLYDNCLTQEFLAHLSAQFPALEKLDLGMNKLKNLPQEFAHFRRLKILQLENALDYWGGNAPDAFKLKCNCFSPDEQEKIRQLLPHTKIIF